jgi:hypothetical protein
MKQTEKIAIAFGIILVLYFVMKDSDKDKDKKGEYEYQRRVKKTGGQYKTWERKQGSRSGS